MGGEKLERHFWFLEKTANIEAPRIVVAKNCIDTPKVKCITHQEIIQKIIQISKKELQNKYQE